MFLTSALRNLRHGSLKSLSPMWMVLGKYYRKIVENIPGLKTAQKIGPYGPFELDAKFAFSNFETWGEGHNNGFESCIEESKSKSCVLDIGAHIGLVALPMSQAVSGTVYAFEPAAKNLMHLKNHIKYNKISNIHVIDSLVGAENKIDVPFYEQDEATGMNARVVKKNRERYHRTHRKQTTIDDFCSKSQLVPQIIKIDVEGAEYDVIRGAQSTLSANSPSIYLSIHPKELELMGTSVDALILLLKELGYRSYDKSGNAINQFGFSEYKFKKND